jgi:hypothetical protein
MKPIFFAVVVLMFSNIASAMPQENNTGNPGKQVAAVTSVDITNVDTSMFEDEGSATLDNDPQENNTQTPP